MTELSPSGLNNIGGKPVIIRIALCDKTDQGKVLGVLTDESYSHLKKIGRI